MTLKDATRTLEEAGVPDARNDALTLICHVCGESRAAVLAHPERDYETPDLKALLARRASREPLQYILGETEFYRERYFVSPACLIPRQDTEVIVETAIKLLPPGAHFADLCTGSGCIGISILANRPDCTAELIDLSVPALDLAKANAERNDVANRATIRTADVLCGKFGGRFDAILSNPPYIQSAVVKTLAPEVAREPRLALDGGEDGMVFYRAITKAAHAHLKERGFLLYEIGYDQEEAIREIALREGYDCDVFRDYGGNARGALLRQGS